MKARLTVDQEAMHALGALLAQGRQVHLSASLLAAVMAGVALMFPKGVHVITTVLVFGAFAAETYLAIRVGLDAQLFARFGSRALNEAPDWQIFDQGLHVAGLRPSDVPTRDITERLRGARHLFTWQIVMLGLQVACMLGLAVFNWGMGT